MSETQRRSPLRGYTMPVHTVTCPHCSEEFTPSPFMGRVILECESCEQLIEAETDGPTFGTSNISAWRYGRTPPRKVH